MGVGEGLKVYNIGKKKMANYISGIILLCVPTLEFVRGNRYILILFGKTSFSKKYYINCITVHPD